MTTKAVDLNSHILAQISQIAGQYGVHIGTNQTGVITTDNFQNAGKMAAFKLDVEDFLNTLKLASFTITTTYNPYEARISWRA